MGGAEGSGGAGGTFLNIPGNIKQKNLPFVLDPSNEINSKPIDIVAGAKDSKNKTGGVDESQIKISRKAAAQLFSFKPNAFKSNDDGASDEKSGFLRIAPGSFYNENSRLNHVSYTKPNKDLSYKLLYKNNVTMNRDDNDKISVNAYNTLNSLPSISIREFLQDSKLNQVVNLFQSIIGGFDQGTKLAKAAKEMSNKDFFSKLWSFTENLMSQIPNIMRDAIDKVTSIESGMFRGGKNADEKRYIMSIPYTLYYRMISSTTTNIYELPYNGKILYQSDGTQGWNKDNGLGGFKTDGNSLAGQVLNFLGGNIKVNTTPTWTPVAENQPIKFELSFDLYNDTLDGAIKNFIFVNTLVPGNKFLQYHIYQHAPNLYDVRIDGIYRLFMCAATVKVEQGGVLRVPSNKFFKRLKDKHSNNKFNVSEKKFTSYIRIPDIYKVTLTFESLLPDTFNNFIYSYYINSAINTKISGNDLRTASAYNEFANKIAEGVAKVWTEANLPNLVEEK